MKVTDKITITNEDNMKLMARYADNHFDLAIVANAYFRLFRKVIENYAWDSVYRNHIRPLFRKVMKARQGKI